MFLELEKKQWNSKGANQIKDYFFPDMAYIKLQFASRKALDLCFEAKDNNNKIDDETYEKIKKEMEDSFKQVRPNNKMSAQVLLSEGMLDLEYAHKDTDITSIRFGMAIAAKKTK